MSKAPECGQKFFIAAPHLDLFMTYNYWAGDRYDIKLLNKGLVHTTESAAIAHAKSMLGIDPDA